MVDVVRGLEDGEAETQIVRAKRVKGSYRGQIPFLYASETPTTARD